jgi:hypothetical protein
MRSRNKSIGRCVLSAACLGIIAMATYGCGNKADDSPKPASSTYYTGAMDKKPTPTAQGGGQFKVGETPGTKQ